MKLKVFHITKMRSVSGSENHLLTLLSEMDKREFDLHLCILAEAAHVPLIQDYKRKQEQVGVQVEILVMRRKILDPAVVWKLRRRMLREQFHIVHTHLIHADLYGTLAAKLAGRKVIVSSRHNDDKFRYHFVSRWGNRVLAHWHDKVIVISDWVGKFLREVEGIAGEKIVRIHYGLEPDSIIAQADPQYVRQQFQIPEGVPLIGTIGQLTEQKGQTYFLQAIKQVLPQVPDLQVVIIGKGKLRAALEQQTHDLGLDAQVIFAGYRNDAVKLLSGFDLFVFPSLWEGFGLVLLESMALKKAIVASRVSAIPESIVDGETGLLVPPRDVQGLAEALLKLLQDKALREMMGNAGYRRLCQEFSIRKMVMATESLYKQVCSEI